MFPDLLGALGAYSDYYADDADPEVKEVFMKILNDMWHERATKYVDDTGEINGEARSILEKALRLIHKNKGIHLRFDLKSDLCNFTENSKLYSLWLEVKEGLDKDRVQVYIPKNTFTERWLPTDDYAGISRKIKELDTTTYRSVRLAYIIYQAIK